MIINKNTWKIVESPGYFGSKSEKIEEELNEKHGKGKWEKAYIWGDDIIDRQFALQLYEDAYMFYFQQNPDILEWLLNNAKDVYDNAVSNIDSGLDYNIQEEKSSHLQDISIRRVILRIGRKFNGNRLIQIRGNNSPGFILNPGQIPFHLPSMIVENNKTPQWARKDSVEAFWQCNKVIIVRNVSDN